jgi:hypothetical protein
MDLYARIQMVNNFHPIILHKGYGEMLITVLM